MTHPSGVAAAVPRVRIRPRRGLLSLDLGKLWQYRELFWFLALRDIKVRYKQTVLGGAWAILQPLLTMFVFNALFSLIGRTPVTGDVPYAVTTYCALLPWLLFATGISLSGNSLVANAHMIRKVYYPRIITPAAPLVLSLLDFAIAFGLLVAMMAGYHLFGGVDFTPGWRVLTVPLFVGFAVVAALAVGIWLAALNAVYRDIRHAIPFLVSLWQFVSPVVYETNAVVPERWRFVYGLNPMAGVIEGFRWALLGRGDPPGIVLLASGGIVLVLLVSGLFYFQRVERTLADVI